MACGAKGVQPICPVMEGEPWLEDRLSAGRSAGEQESRWEGSENSKEHWEDTSLALSRAGWLCVRGRRKSNEAGWGALCARYFGECGRNRTHPGLCRVLNISSYRAPVLFQVATAYWKQIPSGAAPTQVHLHSPACHAFFSAAFPSWPACLCSLIAQPSFSSFSI